MKEFKNNIMLKYSIGLSLIAILILSMQLWILKSFDTLEYEITINSLIFSVIVMPLVGLYIVTKLCFKKNDLKHSHLLTKIFIISIILSIFSAVYIGFRLRMFGNVDEGMLVISEGSANIITNDIIESYEEVPLKTFILIDNIKFILQALIASTLYIGILIITVVRHWINKNLSIDKQESIKQIKRLLVTIVAIIILEVLSIISINVVKGNITIPMTIRLESQITNSEKEKIENKLKEMDEIVNYEFIDSNEASNELDEWFEGTFSNVDSDSYYYEVFMDILSNKNIERFDLTVHNKDVDFIKKELENLDGIEQIQGISF